MVVFCGVLLWKTYETLPPCPNYQTGQSAKPGKYYQ